MFQPTLAPRSIFMHWQTAFLLLMFIASRVLSFAIVHHPVIQSIMCLLLMTLLILLYFKQRAWGWYLALGELLLGGSGRFFEFFGISIRTLFLFTFMLLWILHALGFPNLRERLHIPHRLFYFCVSLILFLALAIGNGVANGHPTTAIIGDFLPYLFFLYLLPAYYALQEEKHHAFFVRLALVFIAGSALFSLSTFAWYASDAGHLQDGYYQWFRHTLDGKITDMGYQFFRVVLPEHLLIVPLILLIGSLLMRNEKHNRWWNVFLCAAILILAINLSRIYFLALAAGLFVLLYTHSMKRWAAVSALIVSFLFLSFTGLHLVASRGESSGWGLLGLRFGGIVAPQADESASFRMALLPGILNTIYKNPLLGVGLGASIPFIHPQKNIQTSTTQFDWGYLELAAEFGMAGAVAYLAMIVLGIVELIKKIRQAPDWHDFYTGLTAGMIAFLIMNVTSPALFHTFGILYFVFVFTFAMKPESMFEQLVTLLYRIFNRLRPSS